MSDGPAPRAASELIEDVGPCCPHVGRAPLADPKKHPRALRWCDDCANALAGQRPMPRFQPGDVLELPRDRPIIDLAPRSGPSPLDSDALLHIGVVDRVLLAVHGHREPTFPRWRETVSVLWIHVDGSPWLWCGAADDCSLLPQPTEAVIDRTIHLRRLLEELRDRGLV